MTRKIVEAACLAAYVAGLLSLEAITGDGNLQGVLAVGFTVLLGFLIGRPWVLLVPVLAMLVLVAYGAVAPTQDCVSCEDDMPFAAAVALTAFFALIGEMALMVGLGLRGVTDAARRRFRPGPPETT